MLYYVNYLCILIYNFPCALYENTGLVSEKLRRHMEKGISFYLKFSAIMKMIERTKCLIDVWLDKFVFTLFLYVCVFS